MDLGRRGGVLAGAALVVLWSSGFVGAELGVRAGGSPLALLGWRFALLAAALLVVAAVRRMPLPGWRAWARQGLLALLCQVAYLLLVFEGVAHGVHGGTAALIAALQPLLVATVAGRLLGERSTPQTWIGMAVGLAGVAVVVSGDVAASTAPAYAYLLPTAGMLCLASGTVLTRRLRPPESLMQSVTMQAVVTAVALMGAAALTGQAAPPANGGFWVAVLWLIVLTSLGGYGMYTYLTRTRGATVVSTLLYLTPPTTMLWVFVMFGEPVTLLGLVGLAITAVGVLLVLRRLPGATSPAADPDAAPSPS
ncbi:Permease of the drug/metabolite transporter (DMT) superfamily [Microlunatus sagamiharensis]|uniref:Permease of the drug/metabolite transporter (DMT) superfamily n=1 Tax=Microlunatus sagamiharensis TaxID=546874 RepID=A0A1H2M1T0_9ACTN|nr:DMT family transporter [Microlunatus sagamiharensis]SDU87207.1 Permease of the drug/metabolite transporter (DMT) superfamily [Microlunatus sagamiharensis]